MKKSHLTIGFSLLIAIFVLVLIQTYVSMSTNSYLGDGSAGVINSAKISATPANLWTSIIETLGFTKKDKDLDVCVDGETCCPEGDWSGYTAQSDQLDLPNIPGPELPGNSHCTNYAYDFCVRNRPSGLTGEGYKKCDILVFDGHAINIVEYEDANGVLWVCIVEPQKGMGIKSFCTKKSDWPTKGWEELLLKILCPIYPIEWGCLRVQPMIIPLSSIPFCQLFGPRKLCTPARPPFEAKKILCKEEGIDPTHPRLATMVCTCEKPKDGLCYWEQLDPPVPFP